MVDSGVVQVTGRGTNVDFVIDDSVPFETVERGLRDYLRENRSLYSRGSITVNVGRRILFQEEMRQIKGILERDSGLKVSRFWCAPGKLEDAVSDNLGIGVAVSDPTPSMRRLPDQPAPGTAGKSVTPPADGSAETPFSIEVGNTRKGEPSPRFEFSLPSVFRRSKGGNQEREEPVDPLPWDDAGSAAADSSVDHAVAPPAATKSTGEPTGEPSVNPRDRAINWGRGIESLLIKTTCRSGEVIRYPGDVIILADVNPGAEVIADGDITVFGSLRGFAHAGAGGDTQATIIALKLDSHRLQIGPYTGAPPSTRQRSRSSRNGPKIAYVRRRSIFVAPYAGRFAGYDGGGILYDG